MHQHLMSKKAISVQKIISKFNTIYQITFLKKKQHQCKSTMSNQPKNYTYKNEHFVQKFTIF